MQRVAALRAYAVDKKAKAADEQLLSGVVQHIQSTETNAYIRARDVLALTMCFFEGLRAQDLAVINVDEVRFPPVASSDDSYFEFDVDDSKTTKLQLETYCIANSQAGFDIVGMMRDFVVQTLQYYADGALSADRLGKFLFSNINVVKRQVTNKRMNSASVTSMLKQRIAEYHIAAMQDITEEELNAIVKPSSSHSLKRGAITTTASKGASAQEIKSLFRFRNLKTPQEYIDTGIFREGLGGLKKPSFLFTSTTADQKLPPTFVETKLAETLLNMKLPAAEEYPDSDSSLETPIFVNNPCPPPSAHKENINPYELIFPIPKNSIPKKNVREDKGFDSYQTQASASSWGLRL